MGLRRPVLWLHPGQMRRLRPRLPTDLLLQGPGSLPILHHAAHGGDRRALGRSRGPAVACAPVGPRRAQATALVSGARTQGPQCGAPHLPARGRAPPSGVHRFGAALNRHVHFHCCVLDGVFEAGPAGRVQFRPAQALTPEALAAIAARVRRRALRWFARSGLLVPADAEAMLAWEHGGFSLDAAVRIADDARAGLEQLLRYCARPAFALKRLTQVNPDRVIYRLPKPQPDGRTALSRTPVELLDRLAAQLENRLAAAAPPSPSLPWEAVRHLPAGLPTVRRRTAPDGLRHRDGASSAHPHPPGRTGTTPARRPGPRTARLG